jgi:hypothetical protein
MDPNGRRAAPPPVFSVPGTAGSGARRRQEWTLVADQSPKMFKARRRAGGLGQECREFALADRTESRGRAPDHANRQAVLSGRFRPAVATVRTGRHHFPPHGIGRLNPGLNEAQTQGPGQKQDRDKPSCCHPGTVRRRAVRAIYFSFNNARAIASHSARKSPVAAGRPARAYQ